MSQQIILWEVEYLDSIYKGKTSDAIQQQADKIIEEIEGPEQEIEEALEEAGMSDKLAWLNTQPIADEFDTIKLMASEF